MCLVAESPADIVQARAGAAVDTREVLVVEIQLGQRRNIGAIHLMYNLYMWA